MSDFAAAMRRIITGDDAEGRSVIIVDGPPSVSAGAADVGGLFEIWTDLAGGPLDPRDHDDRGDRVSVLAPGPGEVKIRWFVMMPTPDGVPRDTLEAATRAAFATIGGAQHIIDQSRHPGMHETHSLDIICLLQGEVSLILEGAETRLKPGQVVIQRGTNHAWEAHGGPALLLAVLIDRPLVR